MDRSDDFRLGYGVRDWGLRAWNGVSGVFGSSMRRGVNWDVMAFCQTVCVGQYKDIEPAPPGCKNQLTHC